jgi:transcriptional regulator with XRE-family HTH domain
VARRAEIPYTTYWRIETGQNGPSLDVLVRIAAALEVTLDELVGTDVPAA